MVPAAQLGRYFGGCVTLVGLAVSAAFLGPRTADPLASSLVSPLPLWMRLLGILAGLVVLVLGLKTVGKFGDGSKSNDEL